MPPSWWTGFDVVPSLFCRWLSAPHPRLDWACYATLPQPGKGLNHLLNLLLLQQFDLLPHILGNTNGSCFDSRRRGDLRKSDRPHVILQTAPRWLLALHRALRPPVGAPMGGLLASRRPTAAVDVAAAC